MDKRDFYLSKKTYLGTSTLSKIENLFDFDIPQKLKILDLGCGQGKIAGTLVKKGHQVLGLDLNKTALKKAKKVGVKTRFWDIEKKLPYHGRSFDLILALDLLEHIFNLEELIWNISRLLRKNGIFILSVPNHFQIRNRIKILRGGGIIFWAHEKFAKPWNYSHIRFLRLVDLRKILETNNLYPTKIQFNFLSSFIWPMRLVPNRIRSWLLRKNPELFSGKFIILCEKEKPKTVEVITLSETPKGY